jgi:O-antigen/teichoic acid export membrane protein
MDKVMIPLFSNISELGLYENAEKIVSLPLSLITTVGIVLLPKMSTIVQTGDKEQQNKYFNVAMKFSLIFAMGLAGGLIGVSPVFVPIFFGEAFQRCSSLISLLAVTVLFLTWSNSIRSQYLIPNKKDKAFIIAAFSGAVINLIFNIILISKYGAAGAVIATIATEFVVALIHTLCSYKELQFKIIIKNVCPFVIPAIMMTLIVRVIGDILFGSILTVILQVAIGGSFYAIFTLAILWYQKDSYFISIKNSLLKRRR